MKINSFFHSWSAGSRSRDRNKDTKSTEDKIRVQTRRSHSPIQEKVRQGGNVDAEGKRGDRNRQNVGGMREKERGGRQDMERRKYSVRQ